jgi:putative peptide zinc metalloprotease protein
MTTVRKAILLCATIFFVLFISIPWKTDVQGVGVAHAAKQSAIHAPLAAMIVNIRPLGPVEAGDALVLLDAPDLKNQGFRNETKTLELTANFSGIWLDTDPHIKSGTWVNGKTPLGILIDPENWHVDVYVEQQDIEHLFIGAQATFYPEHRIDALQGKILYFDSVPVSRLDQPMLASRYGGPISLAEKTGDLVPAEPRFRVVVELEDKPESLRETRGRITLMESDVACLDICSKSILRFLSGIRIGFQASLLPDRQRRHEGDFDGQSLA